MKNWMPPDFGKYAGVGLELAVSVLLGMCIGYLVDKKFHKFPVFTALFLLAGTGIGFYNLYLALRTKNE